MLIFKKTKGKRYIKIPKEYYEVVRVGDKVIITVNENAERKKSGKKR